MQIHLDVSPEDLGDFLYRYAARHNLLQLALKEQQACGGYIFRNADLVSALLGRAMGRTPDLFRSAPFTGPDLGRRSGRKRGLFSLKVALLHLLGRVNDTYLRETADRNRLVLALLKHASMHEQDPFADPDLLSRREAALAPVRRAMAGFRGRRYSSRRRRAALGLGHPFRPRRSALLAALRRPPAEPPAAAPEAPLTNGGQEVCKTCATGLRPGRVKNASWPTTLPEMSKNPSPPSTTRGPRRPLP